MQISLEGPLGHESIHARKGDGMVSSKKNQHYQIILAFNSNKI